MVEWMVLKLAVQMVESLVDSMEQKMAVLLVEQMVVWWVDWKAGMKVE